MGKQFGRVIAVLLALAVIAPTVAWAQGTTGSIRGKVTDSQTGDALAAVNVVVLETDGTATSMGAMTNADGEYVIINVPPGRYDLRASMMGYKQVTVEDFLVTVGVSSMRNFQLEPTVLDVGETVVVQAEREMIQRDVTGTQQSYTIEEMERMAVSSTTDIIALQSNTATLNSFVDDIPGYYDRGLEQVHMRGGRNAEVAFMIDGMQVTNLVFGGQAAQVSPFSLSEMVVMAGGMSAEFGNAMSGVVNMITREGGSSYDANMEVLSSEVSPQDQDQVRDRTSLQGYVGGPIPGVNRLTFFASGSAAHDADYAVKKDDIVFDIDADPTDPDWVPDPTIDYYGLPEDLADFNPDEHDPYLQNGPDGRRIHPVDVMSGYMGYGWSNNWDGMLNLTYKLNPNMKLNLSGQKNGRWATPYTSSWRYAMLWNMPEWWQDLQVLGVYRYDAVDANGDLITDPVTGLPVLDPNNVGDHTIAGTGYTDFENEKNLLFLDNTRLGGTWTHQLNQSTFYSLRGAYYDYNRTMRVKRFVNEEGYIRKFEHIYNGLLRVGEPGYDPNVDTPREDLWTPDDEMHELTLRWILGGYDADDPYRRRYGYVAWGGAGLGNDASDRYYTNHYDQTRTLKGDITSQVTTHHQVKSGFQYNRLTLDMQDIQFVYSDNPSQTRYVKHPWELGMYIQDKVEYDFLILNLGVRYDATNAGPTSYWVDPRNPVHPDTTMTDEERLITNPSTYPDPPVVAGETQSSISPRFGISHPVTDMSVIYFNYGHFFQKPIYRNVYRINRIDRGNPITGNPNLDNEKTVSYEFGYKHQFTEILSTEVVLWNKDTSNMVGTERVPAYFQGVNNPYDYTVAINYDYAQSRGLDLTFSKRYSNLWSARVNYSYMQTISNRDDPWSGYREGDDLQTTPKRPRVVGWDQPHRFSAHLSVNIPEGVGPEIGGIRPLQKVNASIIYRASAGRPYTPTTEERSLDPNSGRRPWTFRWDLRLYRDFETFGLRYSVFADVRNLFDRVNVNSVYSRTGKPDDPGPSAGGYSDSYDRWHYYGTPRTINLGLRIFF